MLCFVYKIGSMCRQSFGFGPNETYTGRENIVVRWRCGWQCFCDGSAWVCDRSEKWISKSSQRHQRGTTIAARDDRVIAISVAFHAANIQNIEEATGTTDWVTASNLVEIGQPIATASLNAEKKQVQLFYTTKSTTNTLDKGRTLLEFFLLFNKRYCAVHLNLVFRCFKFTIDFFMLSVESNKKSRCLNKEARTQFIYKFSLETWLILPCAVLRLSK